MDIIDVKETEQLGLATSGTQPGGPSASTPRFFLPRAAESGFGPPSKGGATKILTLSWKD